MRLQLGAQVTRELLRILKRRFFEEAQSGPCKLVRLTAQQARYAQNGALAACPHLQKCYPGYTTPAASPKKDARDPAAAELMDL